MMYSYGSARNLYGQLTNDTSTANLLNGDSYMNADISRILNKRPWPFLFREVVGTTTATQNFVVVPANYRKLSSVKVTDGTTIITPQEVPNREFWDRLNSTTAADLTSVFPQWWYFFNGRCYLWPTPSTARSITFFGRINHRGLSITEYSTGSVTTATLNDETIVGTSSTAWAAPMSNSRWIKISESASSANKGDGEWYEISSITDATNLELVKPYRGVSISVGTAAYTIGQMSLIPDGYQEAPIYWAVHMFFASKSIPGSAEKAAIFKGLHDDLVSQLEIDYGSETDNVLVEDESIDEQINPNLVVRL